MRQVGFEVTRPGIATIDLTDRLAELGSFTKAAKSLDIGDLRSLGISRSWRRHWACLFQRTMRKVALTAASIKETTSFRSAISTAVNDYI